jgi:hypothetical protein
MLAKNSSNVVNCMFSTVFLWRHHVKALPTSRFAEKLILSLLFDVSSTVFKYYWILNIQSVTYEPSKGGGFTPFDNA